ncbi:polysaccharide pyruvyl transferase family protein [Pseudovibrio exalbescens]|uniref:Nitroreductase n=1 Tax=Pseudovibrio exalbescens TaxID=197461 RepID=A0A1U7JC45_9HYPH|nr:polysaccharide pyruvyl transferase family protein [Pseudovibrio exalbescens]OKL42287.1 hypothetical protein A3843_00945 [Pseudovibrio exalbescens]
MTSEQKETFDVGIVGVGVGANYGSVLTYYGLYRTLEEFGKKPLMISKIGASATDPEIQDTHAMRFAKEHYNLSGIYNQSNLSQLNEIVDAFVVGSDQVWNYGISQNFGKAFYLDFAGDDKRKISYASSFGHAKDFAPEEEVPNISALMKRFNAISVREDTGVALAHKVYNVPATQVAEPIFLTSNERYFELAARSQRDVSEKYLLAYVLDPTPEKRAAILHIAQKLDLKIRVILDGFPHLFDENYRKMGLEGAVERDIETYDFLKLYANCSYVFTDSFHGTAFALKFEKPFTTIGNKRRGIARFDSIFRLIGRNDRFAFNPEDVMKDETRFLSPMDFKDITKRLNDHVTMSKAWLKDAINKPVEDTIQAVESSSSNTQRITDLVGKTVKAVTRQISKVSYSLNQPDFLSNNSAWRIDKLEHSTRLTVIGVDAAIRGNHVWCDLPSSLRDNGAYELTIDWKIRTASDKINIHLRHPESGTFRVIGSIVVDEKTDVYRKDTVKFKVPGEGYSQIMLGAVHFPGVNSGVDVMSISLKPINPDDVVQSTLGNASGRATKSPIEVAKGFSAVDNARFVGAYAQHRVSRNTGNARSLMMFYAHGFEKGLSRSQDFRPGFGKESMEKLAEEMNKWVKKGGSTQDPFFQIAASVLKAYFQRHTTIGVDVSNFLALFDPVVQKAIDNAEIGNGGAIEASKVREDVVIDTTERNFLDVVFGRRSIREFTNEEVHEEDISKAVKIASQAPSVCNRQPARVHMFDSPSAIRAVLDLQGGFRGYKMPQKLLLVTSDLTAFVGAVERNQAFIDGGLFMMGLLLGLEQVGLGACSLNTAMSTEREAAVRKILKLPESEVFISFIAVGHYEPNMLVARSKRLPVEEVLIKHHS